MVRNGFVQDAADPTVYAKCTNNGVVILVVYEDDVLMFSSSDNLLESVVNYFQQTFEIRISPRLNKFLGFTVEDYGESIKINNKPAIERVLSYFGMDNFKSSDKPLPSGLELSGDT